MQRLRTITEFIKALYRVGKHYRRKKLAHTTALLLAIAELVEPDAA